MKLSKNKIKQLEDAYFYLKIAERKQFDLTALANPPSDEDMDEVLENLMKAKHLLNEFICNQITNQTNQTK